MGCIDESDKTLQNEDWIEIRNIDKEPSCNPLAATPPMKSINWQFTPSGTIGAHVRDLFLYFSEQRKFYNARKKIFTFIDLVSKICFKVTIDLLEISSFYFISENELVVVWVNQDYELKQFLYKVDYINQILELQDTVEHTFHCGDFLHELCFEVQPSKFVNLDGIDYVLLVGNADFMHYGGFNLERGTAFCTFAVCLIPKDPLKKQLSTKEFKIVFEKQDVANLKEKVEVLMNEIKAGSELRTFKPNNNTCMVRGTKLWFSYVFERERDWLNRYEVTGNFCEVDLMKLVDLSNRRMDSPEELNQLRKEQEGALRFIERDDIHIAEETNEFHFYHCQRDIGKLYLTQKHNIVTKTHETTLMVYPDEQSYLNGHKECKYTIPDPTEKSCYNELSYCLHPSGALLQLLLNKNGSIRLRVVKCLGMNLKSLALIKALFHKDTPIRNHPAYRLCFNKTKPIEYGNNHEKEHLETQ